LLAPDAEWTIVGSSPLSRTYRNRQEFLDTVIHPFNARMATPLVPTVRGIYADGDPGFRCLLESSLAKLTGQVYLADA
jgi:ketosteroid isomerase-like protein